MDPAAVDFLSEFPVRSRPAHWPVQEIRNRSAIVFLTVCVQGRRPLLARPEIVELLHQVWDEADEWVIGRFVVMPDHVHLFCAPAHKEAKPLKVWVSFWKGRAAKRWPRPEEKPVWQRDFWDRQLRQSESYSEKWEYVHNNPVRAGLCSVPAEWKYGGERVRFRFHDD